MEALKRIINLLYALCGILAIVFLFMAIFIAENPLAVRTTFLVFGGISLVVAVINFSLFKKFTLWNK